MNENIRRKIQSILMIIFAVLLIISYLKINNLSDEINQMNDNLNRSNDVINNQINSIYENIDNKLNEQASLFSEYSFKDGDFNPKNNTAELIINLTPKTVTDDTVISVSFDGKEIPFQRNGNSFSATITADAFKWYESKPVVNIKIGQEIKTQILDDAYIEYLYHNHLGSLTAHSTLNASYSKYNINSEKEKSASLRGFVILLYYSNDTLNNESINKAYIVTELNGKEINKTDVTNKLKYNECEISAEIPYSTQFKVKNNDIFDVFAVIEDSYGYTHKCLVESQQVTEDGADGEFSSEELIYDKNGKLLTE